MVSVSDLCSSESLSLFDCRKSELEVPRLLFSNPREQEGLDGAHDLPPSPLAYFAWRCTPPILSPKHSEVRSLADTAPFSLPIANLQGS